MIYLEKYTIDLSIKYSALIFIYLRFKTGCSASFLAMTYDYMDSGIGMPSECLGWGLIMITLIQTTNGIRPDCRVCAA